MSRRPLNMIAGNPDKNVFQEDKDNVNDVTSAVYLVMNTEVTWIQITVFMAALTIHLLLLTVNDDKIYNHIFIIPKVQSMLS